MQLFWICLGGAFGTGVRYLVAVWTSRVLGTDFPYGTLLVNVVGSVLIGAIMHISLATPWISLPTRLFLTTGVMGGLTTYSAFNNETLSYMYNGAWLMAWFYLLGTMTTCLGAGMAGVTFGRWLAGV